MSLTYRLICDGAGCGVSELGFETREIPPRRAVSDLRRQAADRGWIRLRLEPAPARDLCPVCAGKKEGVK